MLNKKIIISSLTGLIVTLCQVAYIIIYGDAACLNDGCAVVENLIPVPPLPFNLLGAGYFLAVTLSAFLEKRFYLFTDLIDILLLGGMVTEGSLIAFQVFVAGTFCSYCLLICAVIVIMNIFRGKKHFITGLSLAIIEASVFIMLNVFIMLQPVKSDLNFNDLSLTSGTYAVKTCSHTSKRVFLIFSEKCPHCKKVLAALKGCSKCEVHFNPIAKTEREILPGLEKVPDFNPEINRYALHLLDIMEIPVLVVQNSDGYRFIRGADGIIRFIETECSGIEDPFSDKGGFDFLTPAPEFESQGCSITEDCNADNQ